MSRVRTPTGCLPEPPNDNALRELFGGLGIVTLSERMIQPLRQAWKAAQASDANLLIEGETGTGKQVLAHAIHKLDDKRKAFPFVTVHCATIQESLAESELFGHEKGSFSGAHSSRRGLFRAAQHGTLFLDDVNDLPLSVQAKLLDVLQRSVIRPVGCDQEVPVDARVIAASNKPLEEQVRRNEFRLDLYYRLHVIHLQLPPLRERAEDFTPLLIALAHRNESLYGCIDNVDPGLAEYLGQRYFEGNIRQLEHALRRSLLGKTSGNTLVLADWLSQNSQGELRSCTLEHADQAAAILWSLVKAGQASLPGILRHVERGILESALACSSKTRKEVAILLGMSERTFYQRLKEYGLATKVFQGAAELRTSTAKLAASHKSRPA